MKKYDSYKDSGIEWIGEIPSHWDVTRIKYKFQIGRGRVISNEDLVEDAIYPVYSSQTLNNGCLGYIETFDFDDKLITWTTDGANAGTVFLREGKFNCTNVCGTLKGKSDDVIPEFDYYFLQYATQFYKRPDTNGAKIMNNEMAVILSLKLSTEEQTAIAKYLDHKTTQIDHLIAKKEQFIQLLEEERIAVINQAVTKGLDPTVPMKDSGIEWLGEIPVHWELKRMKYLCDVTTGGKDTENREDDGEYPFFVRSQTIERISTYSFDGEAILTAGDGVGVCKVWHYVNEKFDFHQRVYMMCNFKPVLGKYLFYYLKENFGKEVMKLSAKSTVDSLRRPMFQNFMVCFGSLEEQKQIISHIEKEELRIETLINKYHQEIELLKEYKTALISEVVTGKVDVRNEKLN
ncbi:restriction endonuclease subunit S [Flavobacterium sp.]|jgi:type I restriction enzyme S subunit|uniref:restriction endonuclease subunit S n=1 Tax=Flavobacterium sp. TaxID=239 RepID=UPI0037C085A9